MKRILLSLALLGSLSATAGEANKYHRSVFTHTPEVATPTNEHQLQQLQKQFPGWQFGTDKVSGSINNLYGKALTIPGSTPLARAQYCLQNKLGALGIDAADWQVYRDAGTGKAHYVDMRQTVNGRVVMFSRMGFHFTTEGKLLRITARQYGNNTSANGASITKEAAMEAMLADMPGMIPTVKTTSKDWLWFPVPTGNTYVLHPVWEVKVEGIANRSDVVKLRGYVDATNGTLLYRTNDVKEAFDVTVKGNVLHKGNLTPAVLEPLSSMEVIINSSANYTDATGMHSDAFLTGANASFSLQGPWVLVKDYQSSSTPSFAQSFSGTGNTFSFPTNSAQLSTMVSLFYHTNRVHDFMNQYLPSFSLLDAQMEAIADNNTGACNAYFDGSSINFFTAGSGCNSFAEVGDIVYHEYGHGINAYFYYDLQSSPMENGAMNEGYADIWAMSINQDGVLGEGAYQIPGGGFTRRYDALPKVYPEDLVGEVHADGEIIAGAWWDVGQNIGSIPGMTTLFANTYYDLNDGPDGAEGQLYLDVLISALIHDDNDNNINNGTPNAAAIIKAFARHGIYLSGENKLTHTEIKNAAAGVVIPVFAALQVQNTNLTPDVNLVYRKRGGSWTSVALTRNGVNYTGQIPAQPVGTIIDYYFAASAVFGVPDATFPQYFDAGAHGTLVTLPYQFGVGLTTKDSNTFEQPTTAWTIGNAPGDNAVAGIWINAASTPTYVDVSNAICQPAGNHTQVPGGKCLVTGNATSGSPVGTNDVDNGITTAITPSFDLSAYQNPIIEYYRWYTNSRGSNPGSDAWTVKIGNANANNWRVVDSTYQSDHNWRKRIFAVKEYLASNKDVQLRFIASDVTRNDEPNQGGSIVEAAVDDFYIYDAISGVNVTEIMSTLHTELYPNPANDEVYIKVSGAEGTLTIYNQSGMAVYSLALDGRTDKYTISTKALASGQYTVVINTVGVIKGTKLLIQHK